MPESQYNFHLPSFRHPKFKISWSNSWG